MYRLGLGPVWDKALSSRVQSSAKHWQFLVCLRCLFRKCCFASSLWIDLLLRKFTLNSISVRRIHYKFIFSQIHMELSICFANSLWINLLLRKFTLNHFLFRNALWVNFLLRKFTLNSLSVPGVHHEFTICLAHKRGIHYLLREYTMNKLSSSRNNYKFTTYFANTI